MYLKKFLIYYLAMTFLFIWGCGSGTGSTPSFSDNLTDDDIIKGVMEDTYYSLFSTGVIEDAPEENQYSDVVVKVSSVITDDENDSIPHWFRRISRVTKDISIHIEERIADVTVATEIEGNFMIDADGDHELGKKEINDIAIRYAVFERNYDFQGRRWKLKKLSPVEINIREEESRTISIVEVKAYVDGELTWTVNNPSTMFEFPSELPQFVPGEEVIVTAEVENINIDGSGRESYVYLHHTIHVHQKDKRHYGSRRLMYDDGTHGDDVAGDGVFTGTYTIGEIEGYHHAAIDVLDKEMFDDEITQNYNSLAWAMPYLVHR